MFYQKKGELVEEHEGEWKNGEKHGIGICLKPGEGRYEGHYRYGKVTGLGNFYNDKNKSKKSLSTSQICYLFFNYQIIFLYNQNSI